MTGEFQRYLRAKRTVDDRALDRRLLDRLRGGLEALAAEREPLRILEVGAGIGTMIERAVEWGLFPAGAIQYTAVDIDDANVETLRRGLPERIAGRDASVTAGETLTLDGADWTVTVEPIVADAVEYVTGADREWDLLVGAALLDIVPLADLPALLGGLDTGGLFYFPITFDGATRFQPAHPADRAVERHYHDHMDGKPGGNSRAGGATLARCRALDGVTLLDAAGSDWIVRPVDDGYPGDEAYFLRHILETVETAVGESAPEAFGATLADWLDTRRTQLDAAELVYLTHQLDLLGRLRKPETVR